MIRKYAAAAAIALAGISAPALADPALGIWKTETDDGAYAHVTMQKCGETLCGHISRTFNASGEYKSENLGARLVWDMEAQGGGSYKGGKIWQPSTGKVYRSKMALNGNVLNVSGCVGPICKKQSWQRVK